MADLQLRHEQVESAQAQRIEELKSHLASVIGRTTRIRTAYDKEKRQLVAQVREFQKCFGLAQHGNVQVNGGLAMAAYERCMAV